jgi:hypothetical protein
MAERIRALYPGCSPEEAGRIAAHTAARGTGCMGRSAAGRALDDQALKLAVGAWVRYRWRNNARMVFAWQRRARPGRG